MSEIDKALAANTAFGARLGHSTLGAAPLRRLAVVCCMDSRIDVFGALGLNLGEAHVIRNAGGVATEDVIRSLSISQHMLGTESVMVIQHEDCGLMRAGDEEFASIVERASGRRPPFAFGAFKDVEQSVAASVAAIRDSVFLLRREDVRGFVYDVSNGRLREVETGA